MHSGHCRHIAIAILDADFIPSLFSVPTGVTMIRRERTSPFLDSLREAIRVRHYSIRTEKAYVGWARRFILFHDKRHPKDMVGVEVAAFLSHLALELEVSPRHRIRR